MNSVMKEIISREPDLAVEVGPYLDHLSQVECRVIDQSYLDFLDEQILLAARGDEWSNVLDKRRKALSEHVGVELLSASLEARGYAYFIRVNPVTRKVVYWERHEISQ